MTSSMLTGERRWASGRRGGMTVLGKVAVPRPINLPSQRLENHGLDPNVEIVPKGTHSWGSRSSSSTSNAWGSSTLSPNTDGGTGSPSHLSGRPSSGGSGTRPSTAGSDRAHEPIANAWGSNSRPSSASGALTSNQTALTSLRPRSAETRPGSSQLSRFAEPLSDNSVVWGATGTAEKLGVSSSKNHGFSLTSGDFPTLGSEKETSGKNTEFQDHGSHSRPGSSSGAVTPGKGSTGNSVGDVSANANMTSGIANSWRRENLPYGEDGTRPSVEKWHADAQRYPNSNIPPQHYDTWHGPPVNNHPGGVWYRGPPGGPPFPPGGFPMEPFAYYRPQIPPAALANPQPVPPPGAGPRGPHPKNGDMYRPHMHDAYIRPGIPLRPGFYPGPVPYEGYYGPPPMGYCNSNERDIPFMGMAVGPTAYNRYSGQNAPDLGSTHGRSSGYGPSGKAVVSEQLEYGHPQDPRGPCKVLLKQHDGWEGKDEQKWDDSITAHTSYPGKGDHPKNSSWENDWRADRKKDEEMDTRRMAHGEDASSEGVDNRAGVAIKVKSPESVGNLKASDDSSVKELERTEHAASAFPEASAASKDPSLIQKIEGLNAKARASDGRQDVKPVSRREEQQKNKLQAGNFKYNHSTNEVGSGSVSLERTHVSGIIDSHEDLISAADKSLESTVVSGTGTSRRSTHGMHGRTDHRGKGRVVAQEADGWRKRSQVTGLPSEVSSLHFETSSVVHGQDQTPAEVTEKSGSYPRGKDDGGSMPPNSEPSDSQAQRAKMRELAKQRLEQREKEEEERTRDQKAKALAKLEELNRRTQGGEGFTQKLEAGPGSANQNKQEEFSTLAQPTGVASKSKEPNLALGSNPVTPVESSASRVEKSTSLSSEVPQKTSKTAHKESLVVLDQSEPMQQQGSNGDTPNHNNASQVNDTSSSKQKRGYRQKQNSPLEITSNEKLISSSMSTTETSKSASDLAANATAFLEGVANEVALTCESSLPVNTSVMAEAPAHHKRKNRNGKSKHKVEEASSMVALPSVVSKDATALDALVESGKPKTSESVLDPSSVQSQTDSKDANQSFEQRLSVPNEEARTRVSNQWKSQHTRRMPRNPQASKSTEKFHNGDAVVWAPVRSQNKTEVTDETSQKTAVEAASPSMKNDQQVQNNPRNKRAEMERYVPKPVAKEMAQQGSSHQSVAPINQATSDETVERPKSGSLGTGSSQTSEAGTGKVGSAIESRNGDGRQNKAGKVHGSWRQRGSTESALNSNPSRNSQKSIENRQHQKPDLSSVKEQSSYSDEWTSSDGWNIPKNPDAPVSVSVVKDHGITARGKWQPYKGQQATGYNHDPDEKRINSGDTEKAHVQSSASEMYQADLPASLKENRAAGERSTPHWQPKSQPFSATNQRGSRANGGQNVGAEVGRANKKDSTPLGGVPLSPQPDKETAVVKAQPHHDQSLSEKSNLEEAPSVGHQEPKRERKIASHKGRPGSPVEPSSPSNTDFRHEQHAPSGFRKNGNQNSRFGREHESHGDSSGSGKDNKQHNVPANRERQRHNSHYEYQPVGPLNNSKANSFESPKDGSHNSGAKFRERGQSHSRRGGGNFYGRQTGSVRVVDTSCD